jgi:hypothetical protein
LSTYLSKTKAKKLLKNPPVPCIGLRRSSAKSNLPDPEKVSLHKVGPLFIYDVQQKNGPINATEQSPALETVPDLAKPGLSWVVQLLKTYFSSYANELYIKDRRPKCESSESIAEKLGGKVLSS